MSRLMQMSAPVVDNVYHIATFPRRGTETPVTGHYMAAGGGLNAMAAARAAGMELCLGGSIGTGPLADMVTAALDRLGAGIGRDSVAGLDQGLCTVLIEPDGERSFITQTGAEAQFTAEALDRNDLGGVDWLMLSGYSLQEPASGAALARWIADLPRHIGVLFDPSPLAATLSRPHLDMVLSRADWISANAEEAQALTPADTPDACALALATGRQGAILRQGAAGCLLAHAGQLHALPPHPVTPRDTNGAGDTHIGSFIAELARTGDPLRAARYANIAAALSTTREGAASAPARGEVEALLDPTPTQAGAS